MDISNLPYCDFVIHRKLAGIQPEYIIRGRGSGKSWIQIDEDGNLVTPDMVVTKRPHKSYLIDFDSWNTIKDAVEDHILELKTSPLDSMFDAYMQQKLYRDLHIATYNPYSNFQNYVELRLDELRRRNNEQT